ncbi:MAG: DUF5655 domain-containing protein [Anaerolineales bacterium]
MNQKRSKLVFSMFFIVLFAVSVIACDAIGEISRPGDGAVNLPEEPVEPPPQETEAQPEPTIPPQPTQAPEGGSPAVPPSAGDEGSSDELMNIIRILLFIIIIVIVLGVIVWIISLLTRSDKKAAEPVQGPVAPPMESQRITENTHLKNASPAVKELYNRYVELIKSYGPVSIIPTESRIDFQARTIFSSVQFRLESLEIKLVLPRIIQDEKVIRVDTISADKYSHLIMVDELDDFDARFNAWLGESYNQAS